MARPRFRRFPVTSSGVCDTPLRRDCFGDFPPESFGDMDEVSVGDVAISADFEAQRVFVPSSRPAAMNGRARKSEPRVLD